MRNTSTKKSRGEIFSLKKIDLGELGNNSYVKKKRSTFKTAIKNLKQKINGFVNNEEMKRQLTTSQSFYNERTKDLRLVGKSQSFYKA